MVITSKQLQPRKTEVRIGDTIITSGIVGGFPKGLAIGQVTRISYSEDHVNQVTTIELWVDFEKVEGYCIKLPRS